MQALPYSITISDKERIYLKSLTKTRTIQAQVVDRACMLLCCYVVMKVGSQNRQSHCRQSGISVNTVRHYIDRYLSNGINLAIFDDERSGRLVEVTDEAKSWIVSIACQMPCDFDYAVEL